MPVTPLLDAIVVGAGLSGLVAARRLQRANKTVLVLEASERIGGKMHTISVGKSHVDLGAHWIGPGQTQIAALAEELGVKTAPQPLAGKQLMRIGEKTHLFRGFVPRLSLGVMADIALGTLRLERMRDGVGFGPEDHVQKKLDMQSAAELMHGLLRTPEAKALFEMSVRLIFGASSHELSAHHFLAYLHSGEGYMRLSSFEGGAQQDVFVGGAAQICHKLAERLPRKVQLQSPVTALEQHHERVIVYTEGASYEARRVICAMAPPLLSRLRFSPALPSCYISLQQHSKMGTWSKCVVTYQTPWWRAEGLCGVAMATEGLVQMVIDGSDVSDDRGILVCMVTADEARRHAKLPEAERLREVREALVRLFGPRASAIETYTDYAWSEDVWCGGAPVALPARGLLSSLGSLLREPVGRIHWAGTDLATHWNGYMEGAIESGERAAEEVIEGLA